MSEHVHCVAITFKMTEQVEQHICIKFSVKLEHSSAETVWMIPMQQWATGDLHLHHHNAPAHASRLMQFFGETSNHSGDSAQIWHPVTSGFPKTKITFEREEISDHQ